METRSTLMSIFWVVFVFTKNEKPENSDAIGSTTILYSLFRYLFGELVADFSEAEISAVFRRQFTECKLPTPE